MRKVSPLSRPTRWVACLWLLAVGCPAWAQVTSAKPLPAKGKLRLTDRQTRLELAGKVDLPLCQPKTSKPDDVHELVLGVKRFETGGNPASTATDQSVPSKFELICYNGEPVGPTIRVRRGAKLRIRVKNDLKGLPDPGPGVKEGGIASEAIHSLCSTNLHTHGLHVSPAGKGDNVFRVIEPRGGEFTFEYDVPANHRSGTFWYHPHRHGSSAYQVSNGLAGALIVDGVADDGIDDLEDIPEIAAASAIEQVLILQWYTYTVSPGDGVGRINAASIYNVNPAQLKGCEELNVTDDPSTLVNLLAINGCINPTIAIKPGEVQRWRVIHAGWDQFQRFVLVDDAGNPVPGFKFREIALDEIATGSIAELDNLSVAPGQRSDLLFQAPPLPAGKTSATYHLKRLATDAAQATHNIAADPIFVAKVVVSGAPHPMNLPDPVKSRDKLARCRPFPTIVDGELTRPTISNGTLELAAKDPTGNPADPVFYTINFRTYHQQEARPIPLTLNTAQEWTLTARASNHPFHIHVNPFQVTEYQGSDPDLARQKGQWRDTLYIQEGESYTIRSRFLDYAGDSVLHCHILDHEDQGMMHRIRLIDPNKPPVADVDVDTLLKDGLAEAPALRRPEPGGGTRGLDEFRGRKVALVFFQGAECGHCAERLGDLVREARWRIGPDSAILAVSSRKVSDRAKALKALGVQASDRFHLLVDEGHGSFRDYGCYADGSPTHGLFLVDQAGMIRSSYVGRAPFADSKQVVDRLRALDAPGRVGSR